MENSINLLKSNNPYLQHFQIAQGNLQQLIREERMRRRMKRIVTPQHTAQKAGK